MFYLSSSFHVDLITSAMQLEKMRKQHLNTECHPVYTIHVAIVLWINNLPLLYLLPFINIKVCQHSPGFTWLTIIREREQFILSAVFYTRHKLCF